MMMMMRTMTTILMRNGRTTMNSPNPTTNLAPSASTVAGALIGVPLATILVWVIGLRGIVVPPEVATAFGALFSVVVGYFPTGGRAQS